MEAALQCADPLLHMKQIAQFGLGWDGTELYRNWNTELNAESIRRLDALLARRMTGEPFQYITGQEWFWNSSFAVGPGVLIPRKETEGVVELFLNESGKELTRVAELGAGSGNIGISVLLERPQTEWHAFETNPKSLVFLEMNRRKLLNQYQVGGAYLIQREDFFVGALRLAPFDWIVSNPPYVSTKEMASLSREVSHEPSEALEGGATGADFLMRLLRGAPDVLRPGGRLILEIGHEHAPALMGVCHGTDFSDVRVFKDLAGKDRVFTARWR